jgi:hypothetical protein
MKYRIVLRNLDHFSFFFLLGEIGSRYRLFLSRRLKTEIEAAAQLSTSSESLFSSCRELTSHHFRQLRDMPMKR